MIFLIASMSNGCLQLGCAAHFRFRSKRGKRVQKPLRFELKETSSETGAPIFFSVRNMENVSENRYA